MRLVLRRGRLEAQRAGALITSANDALCGNDQPAYWRFEHRDNVDGALRAAAGPALARACLELPRVEDSDVRRDIARWPGGCKRGASAPVRCPTGSAVATAASGDLDAAVVVHAVAPDVELTHGRYSGRYSGSSDDRDRLPEELLRGAYAAALAAAAAAATTAACPALGAGVKGWAPAVTAAFGLDAAARAAGGGLDAVAFVLGDDAAWRDWARVAAALLGPPAGGGAGLADAAASGADLEWTLAPAPAGGGDALRLRDLPEFGRPRASWATEAAGTRSGGNAWRWNPSDVRAV